jgi:predicted acylesterase/phospholipase RssA
MFKPVKWQGRTLVDGGMVNTFPLNRVERTPGDILVGFNVNQIDAAEIQGFLDSRAAYAQGEAARREEAKSLLKDTLTTAERGDFLEKMAKGGQLIRESIDDFRSERKLVADGREGWIPVDADDNYASILQRSFGIMNCTIARMGIELAKPDILVDLPFDSYHGVYGYSHAEEICEKGRELMAKALDNYEKAQ